MLSFDVRNFTDDQRRKLAWKAHEYQDFKLPRLDAWNYDPCRIHARGWVKTYTAEDGAVKQKTVYEPKPACQQCGIVFRQHQRVGIMWLYLAKDCLLADTMGSGKTTEIGGLVAMLLQTGELPEKGRVVIVPRAAALRQWNAELLRMMPGLNLVMAEGLTKKKRIELYLQNWQVLLIGPEMLRYDAELIMRYKLAAVITDDIDQLRNPDNETSYWLNRIGNHADRYVKASGTPLQKRLPELHAILGAEGRRAFGEREWFEKRYIRYDTITDIDGRGNETVRTKVVGVRNMTEFKRKLAPLVLRRTAADLKDVTLPTIIPEDVYLDLHPRQRAYYNELKKGVIQLLKEDRVQTKRVTALSKLHYGSAICAGLSAMGEEDGPGTSMKLDWVMDKLGGDLSDEKVVIFANLKDIVRSLQYRLRDEGTGFVTIWGVNKSKADRHAAQQRFWNDPHCKVLIGTKSIEQSLNLQVSRHLINIDTILNPARMEQLAGRIRRDGSAHPHVFVHNLLSYDTQEARYPKLLEREAAVASHVWDESSQLFKALDPIDLLQLITG